MLSLIGAMILGIILIIVGGIMERHEKKQLEQRFRERWAHYEQTGDFIGIDQWPD